MSESLQTFTPDAAMLLQLARSATDSSRHRHTDVIGYQEMRANLEQAFVQIVDPNVWDAMMAAAYGPGGLGEMQMLDDVGALRRGAARTEVRAGIMAGRIVGAFGALGEGISTRIDQSNSLLVQTRPLFAGQRQSENETMIRPIRTEVTNAPMGQTSRRWGLLGKRLKSAFLPGGFDMKQVTRMPMQLTIGSQEVAFQIEPESPIHGDELKLHGTSITLGIGDVNTMMDVILGSRRIADFDQPEVMLRAWQTAADFISANFTAGLNHLAGDPSRGIPERPELTLYREEGIWPTQAMQVSQDRPSYWLLDEESRVRADQVLDQRRVEGYQTVDELVFAAERRTGLAIHSMVVEVDTGETTNMMMVAAKMRRATLLNAGIETARQELVTGAQMKTLSTVVTHAAELQRQYPEIPVGDLVRIAHAGTAIRGDVNLWTGGSQMGMQPPGVAYEVRTPEGPRTDTAPQSAPVVPVAAAASEWNWGGGGYTGGGDVTQHGARPMSSTKRTIFAPNAITD